MNKFDEYKKEIEANHKEYMTLCVGGDVFLQNGNNTSERKAPKGYSWIDYWRAMSGNHNSRLECSSCGNVIFTGDVSLTMKKMYGLMGLNENENIALGGHLLVKDPQSLAKDPQSHDYSSGFYIAPLCLKCNGQRGKNINIKKGTLLCKEVTDDL